MEKIKETISLIVSRIYVRILSITRATHSMPVEEPQPKIVHVQNRKSFLFLILILSVVFATYSLFVQAPEDFTTEELITIKPGLSLKAIAQELERDNMIQSAQALIAIIRLRGDAQNIHAGDYLFHKPHNVFSIARIIATGAFGLEPVRVTIKEGANVREMAYKYDRVMLRFDKDKFIKLALPLEGYLYPDTYFFLPNAKESEIIDVMHENFLKKIKPLEQDIANSGKTIKDIITMASIIEKEARIEKDRKMISGVLWHRLDINMPLQVDATFVYTHGKGSSQITMAELLDESNLYNTYKHNGLPPGPICSPSISSITAALHPKENNYLFYLADKYGHTYYSKTYKEHLRKRAKYIQ